MGLAQKNCVSCKGASALSAGEAAGMLKELSGWEIVRDGKWLHKVYKFKNFIKALDFVNRVGAEAEREGHHPDIKLGWGYVEIDLQTHDVGGLHANDFILAAKIDTITG